MVCISLLPLSGLADAMRYHITFDAMPGKPGSVVEGLVELLEMLQIDALLTFNDNPECEGFEMEASLMLEEDEATRLDFFLYGLESLFHIQSPLFRDYNLLINVPAILEFCMKIYNHMDIPLQYISLCYPYVTVDPLRRVWSEIEHALSAPGDKGEVRTYTVDAQKLAELGRTLQDMTYTSREVRIWLEAMTSISGAGESLTEIIDNIPYFLEEYVPEIQVYESSTERRWTIGDKLTLFHSLAEDNKYTAAAYVPGLIYGSDFSMEYVLESGPDTYNVHFSIILGEDDNCLLRGTLDSDSLPSSLHINKPFSAEIQFEGALLDSLSFFTTDNGCLDTKPLTDGLHFRIEGSSDSISLCQDGKKLITAVMQTEAPEVYGSPDYNVYDIEGLNLLSLYDSTLSDFLSDIKDLIIPKVLPIIRHLPVSTVVSLMDVLQDGGVLDLLAYGADFGFSEEEEEYEEEDW